LRLHPVGIARQSARGFFAALVLWAGAASAHPGAELGARYWGSSGTTTWSHNAQVVEPLLGNPTSVLTYSDLDAGAGELFGRAPIGERWYVKGNLGIGQINGGSFGDKDYLAGQVKFSDSTSSVRGDRMTYATVDLGYAFWTRGADALSLFVGAQRWRERLDAYGATFADGGGPSIPPSTLVISNDALWSSLRLGAALQVQMRQGLRLLAEVALVPSARLRNEDSHFLRQDPGDLGPVPNVINEGDGRGVQAELELRGTFREHWELGAGLRYWRLETTEGTSRGGGATYPLVGQESRRGGVLLSVSRRW
jgi:hypothetical protein